MRVRDTFDEGLLHAALAKVIDGTFTSITASDCGAAVDERSAFWEHRDVTDHVRGHELVALQAMHVEQDRGDPREHGALSLGRSINPG